MLNKTAGRRAVLAGAAAAFVTPGIVRAEDAYPSRPIKFIVPYTPAGATDNLSRIDMAKVSELLGQQIVIDNRAGSGGTIGTDAIAKAAPDLAAGASDRFQSFVAHAMHMEAEAADEQPAPRQRLEAPSTESNKPAAAEGPFGKLRRWFGS